MAETEEEKKETIKKKTVTKKVVKKVAVVKKKTALDLLKEKAKVLEGKVEDVEKVDIKEKVTGKLKESEDTLVPIEDYLKSSMHLGTRVITPHMRKYIYKRRADGLSVFNTNLLDEMIRKGGEYLAKYNPEDIIVVCKRESGWKAVKKFGELLGIRVFTKKYPAGVLTNTNLDDFFETELAFICDPWLDKNALRDAGKVKTPVFGICDSNNYTFGIDEFVVGNNKSAKSLGIIFYLLAKLYIEKRKLDVELPGIEEFVDDWENLVPPK